MAQRNSRKNRARKKQPELRTGGGRKAKAERSRARGEVAERSASAGPAVRVRPAGPLGMGFLLLMAWLGVALIAGVGLYLDRWNVFGYPDSLWLYVAFGCATIAPAVGRVARGSLDADAWGLQSLVVPAGLFVAEAIVGPSCPVGADCAAIGARGALGLPLSLLVIAALAFVSWALARWMYRSAEYKRPGQGRVRYRYAAVAMLMLLLFPGTVIAAALVGTDLFSRDAPELALEAQQQVEEECYGLQEAPELVSRAAPRGYNPGWITFAVRRAREDRPGIGKDKLPSDWTGLDYVHPYEATVSFNQNGDVVSISCRRVGPGTGNAVADDLVQPEPDSNPLSPKTIGMEFLPRFFTQGVAGPSEEAKQKAREEAAAERRAKDASAEETDAK